MPIFHLREYLIVFNSSLYQCAWSSADDMMLLMTIFHVIGAQASSFSTYMTKLLDETSPVQIVMWPRAANSTDKYSFPRKYAGDDTMEGGYVRQEVLQKKRGGGYLIETPERWFRKGVSRDEEGSWSLVAHSFLRLLPLRFSFASNHFFLFALHSLVYDLGARWGSILLR